MATRCGSDDDPRDTPDETVGDGHRPDTVNTSTATVAAMRGADTAQELLKSAGMSGYEAKAYLALLASPEPANGYEVAKASGVPRSTVYETLGKLVARGAAFEVATSPGGSGNGVAYVALPAEALIGRLRREATGTINGLEMILPQLGRRVDTRVVQHLAGRDEIVRRSVDVVEGATTALWMSIWPQESAAFVAPVAAAIERGVDVSVIAYGDVAPLGGRVYEHSYSSPAVVLERLQCRISIVVADHDQVIIGGVTDDEAWGLWSDDRAVALVAAEHVRHDIALQLIGARLHEAGLEDFWTNDSDLERLRDAAAADVTATRSTAPT